MQIDVDGRGFQSPRDYASTILLQNPTPSPELVEILGRYDPSVIVQALTILGQAGTPPETIRDLFRNAGPELRNAFEIVVNEWNTAGSRR